MLGAEDALVGASRNVYDGPAARYYAAMDPRLRERRLSAPGNWDFISTEGVAALIPDLVIVWAQQTESIAALEALGIPCYGVFLRSLADIVNEIRGLGALTARDKRAGEIVARAEVELREVASRVASLPGNQRPRTYFAWSQGLLETSGGVGLVQELLERAGTSNVCAAIREEHAVVDVERLLAWNPELLVLWGDERRSPRDVLSDTRLGRLEAVRRGRVHELPDVFLTDLWTLKLAHAVRLVATWAHPGLFAEAEIRTRRNSLFADLYAGKLPMDALPGEEGAKRD
jgi:iron complex transport system substrate-binding protein